MSESSPLSIVSTLLFAAEQPLSIQQLREAADLSEAAVKEVLAALPAQLAPLGMELVNVREGWRIQVDGVHTPWVHRLYQDGKQLKLSRAQLETLAIIAHRQPVTRAEIEQIRGVSVSSQVMQALQAYGWIRTHGHKDVPGKPALWVTTPQLLEDLGLQDRRQLQTTIDDFLQQAILELKHDDSP